MNIYFLIYGVSAFFIASSGVLIWRKLRNISGIFFFLHAITAAIWFILYFFFFSGLLSTEQHHLLLSRLSFGLSVISIYSLLFFSIFYGIKTIPRNTIMAGVILVGFIILFGYTSLTPLVIESLSVDTTTGVYREIFGSFYILHLILYIIFFPLLIGVFITKLCRITGIEKIRFLHTSIAGFIFFLLLTILQVILPIYGIWILEREVILFADAYIFYVLYVIHRYYFRPIWYDISRIISGITSFFIAIVIVNYLESEINMFDGIDEGLWMSSHDIFTHIAIGILIFLMSYKLIQRYIFGKVLANTFQKRVLVLEKELAHLMDYDMVNTTLRTHLMPILQVTDCTIQKVPGDYRKQLKEYFHESEKHDIFINEISFIEDKKIEEGVSMILKELQEENSITIPLLGKKKNIIGLFMIGKKVQGNFFDSYEMEALQNLANFLTHHLEYLDTHNKLADLTKNLDRRIDEKTIAYNTLISRQREFITLLTHEIKTPVTTGILQLDNLFEDYKNNLIDFDTFINELYTLQENLILVKDMLSKLFSIEFIERKNDNILYPSITDVLSCIGEQIDIHKRAHSNIIFEEDITAGKIFMNIDRTQFIQVINNLLGNAIKFAQKKDPHIWIQVYRDEAELFFAIEDNGSGVGGHDYRMIFEKYHSSHRSLGLGIGLYLCKKIIDLHGGNIHAMAGKKLGGMRVEIRVPIQENLTN